MLVWFIWIGIGLMVAAWVLAPLLEGDRPAGTAAGETAADLYLEKQRAYESLRDVDFDYHTGKLSESDYRNLQARFRQEAIAALRKLDALEGTSPSPSSPEDPEGS